MPRIVPLQLLKCLKVLLDDNGGILSESEVKRIAGLMTKYSKKLVSKCIYVQILKCTKTELLGEFMGAGGWSLTHTWLNDAIRARNWPLVQEILELLLLCPVDVERLKSNSAPKLVKGLCKDGDDEGVRILASKLVEQWLKVVTGDATTTTTQMAPKPSDLTASVSTAPVNSAAFRSDSVAKQPIKRHSSSVEEDPLGSTEPPIVGSFQPTLAQKKATESGLVLKCIVKDGKQVWARVDNITKTSVKTDNVTDYKPTDNEVSTVIKDGDDDDDEEEKCEEEDQDIEEVSANPIDTVQKPVEELSAGSKSGNDTTDNKENEVSSKKKDSTVEKEKSRDKEKEKEREKSSKSSSSEKDKKSSSSSSSSNHKSSSSSSHKSSSSKSSSKSSSSKSSHRSSTDSKSRDKDKERDKERSSNKERSSDKDKDKHRSSSSSKSSSSSSSKDKDRHRDKSSSSSSSIKKDKEKEREKSEQVEKDKEAKPITTTTTTTTPSIDKLGKIPKKPKDDSQEIKPTSITIPSKKASMSIEIRRDSEKAKTVKTYQSQFRSHGLTEEAPPPPSRKGLKKPNSAPVPGTAIPNKLTLKRPSPPPSSLTSSSLTGNKDIAPVEKKAKIEMAALAAPVVEKIGAIKLIPPKKSYVCCGFAVLERACAYNSTAGLAVAAAAAAVAG